MESSLRSTSTSSGFVGIGSGGGGSGGHGQVVITNLNNTNKTSLLNNNNVNNSNMNIFTNPLHWNVIPSCDVESKVKIKIGTLEGKIKRPDYEKILEDPLLQYSGICQQPSTNNNGTTTGGPSNNALVADLQVQVQLYSNGTPICPTVSTSYKYFGTRWNWNEWLVLPLRFSDLPKSTLLAITIYDCVGADKMSPIGGSTISLFGKNSLFRQGMMDLRVWPGTSADGSSNSLTPGKGPKGNRMHHLHKLTKKHRLNQMPKLDWLDRLAFAEIETIVEKEKRESDFLFLNIEFPLIEYGGVCYNIAWAEKYGGELLDDDGSRTGRIGDESGLGNNKWLPDHEIWLDNLVENKHHALSRATRSGASDIDLKPNASVRDALNAIVNYPPTKVLSGEELDLVWKFRYYLSANKRALPKFLKCVSWEDGEEEKESLDLLDRWSAVDGQDALELLGPSFRHPSVRRYAVSRLRQSPDEDLLMYLLQLVQALKYENFEQIRDALSSTGQASQSQQQQQQLSTSISMEPTPAPPPAGPGPEIPRVSSQDAEFESKSFGHGGLDQSSTIRKTGSNSSLTLEESALGATAITPSSSSSDSAPATSKSAGVDDICIKMEDKPDLATFLIFRACENTTLVNYFYWYLVIECEDVDVGVKSDPAIREMYMNVMKRFLNAMKKGKPEWASRRALLSRQQKLIAKLIEVVKIVAKESASRPKKIEKLQALLSMENDRMNFTKFEPLPFALDPEVLITGLIAKEATLFKSSQMPCKLLFTTVSGAPYSAIFKHGDDLRQDQLILQIIALMDKLLRKENLDLKLSPYRVLATSTSHGFVQFIPSATVADVLAIDGSIHNFFRKAHPSESDPYGIAASVMDSYVKSTAGYCVITYLLGVGDRHLDNLLLTKDGRLFHIDFGYILGRDPKPMPPPMKLSKEMVEAMGGLESEHYQEFRKLCYTAFLHLRRHANLILNLFSLMVGASVPDIALEPDKTVKKVLDKFRLDLNDEGAVKYMQELIDISVTSFMPALLEQMHKFTQILRK